MASFPTPAGGADTGPGGAMTPPDRAPKTSGQASGQTSGRSRLARFLSLRFPVFLALASLTCFALPQQAAAQTTSGRSAEVLGRTFTIHDAEAVEGGVARFRVTVSTPFPADYEDSFGRLPDSAITYPTADAPPDAADPENDLGVDRPTAMDIPREVGEFFIEVPIVDDGFNEGDETFRVRLRLAGEADIQATGTIVGAAAADTLVSISESASATEGSPVTFTVNLSAAVSSPVTVRWTVTSAGGNAAATLSGSNSDLASSQVLTGTVEFAANDTSETFSIATRDDDLVEGNETFRVTLSEDTQGGNPLPDGVIIDPQTRLLGPARQGIGLIADNDTATLSIGDGSAGEAPMTKSP